MLSPPTPSTSLPVAEPSPSQEEADLLERSNRRKKHDGIPPQNESLPSETPAQRSYKETLTHDVEMSQDWVAADDSISDDEDEPVDDGIPSIRFSATVRQEIRANFTNSIIVKILGISVGFPKLVLRLKQLWSVSEFDAMLLGNGYCLIKFE